MTVDDGNGGNDSIGFMLTVKNMPYDVARGSLVDRLEGYIRKPFDIWELRKEIGANLGISY